MLLLGVLIYGVTFLLRWRILRNMLGVVKSEAVARLLENDPGQLDRRGEERLVTVLFAHIRDFGEFAANHSAHEVVELLNAYFTALVPIIERHGGNLQQYMGDRILVLFGAPGALPDHALQAVRAAAALSRQVRACKGMWADLGFPGLQIRVGIHTGRVVAGAVGSPHRLDYTIVGDAVNTAAVIEMQNQDFGTEILISADTFRDLPAKERSLLGCDEQAQPANVKPGSPALMVHAVS